MTDEEKKAAAQTVFNDLCRTLDQRGWQYSRRTGETIIDFNVTGDDMPMRFVLEVDGDRQLIRLFSTLPFNIAEDKRLDLAIATCAATNSLLEGSFDYDVTRGRIAFRMTNSFKGSRIGAGTFNHMVNCSSGVVDRFNDQFMRINLGVLNVTDFIDSV